MMDKFPLTIRSIWWVGCVPYLVPPCLCITAQYGNSIFFREIEAHRVKIFFSFLGFWAQAGRYGYAAGAANLLRGHSLFFMKMGAVILGCILEGILPNSAQYSRHHINGGFFLTQELQKYSRCKKLGPNLFLKDGIYVDCEKLCPSLIVISVSILRKKEYTGREKKQHFNE